MAAARTKLVYQRCGSLNLHITKIISITPISSLPEGDQLLVKNNPTANDAITTEETIFYVQGGGQPTDTGVIESTDALRPATFEVHSVRHPLSGGQILHFGSFKGGGGKFVPGDEIIQKIDAEKRRLYSQLHTAGHILGLAINSLISEGTIPSPLVESKASHYPDSASVEFVGHIDGKFKEAIQARTDELVKANAEVRIHWWSMEKLLSDCMGVGEGFELPEGETKGRVVEMVGLGAYPCGGTHVERCEEVGKIEVKKISRSKGVSKVSYRVI
jgi:Ser-tRNA(Ala) deacylase AlaX